MNEPSGPLVPLDYGCPAARPGLVIPSRLVAIAAVFVWIFLVLSLLFSSLSGPLDQSPREKCVSNMRQIGQAIAMYANEHGDRFPDDVKTILENEDLTPSVFVCPSSNDQPTPPGPTTQTTAAALLQPGHLSYIYLGKGLTSQTATADTVLLYEPLTNHSGDGMNVLFGDFHVEWLSASEAATILKQVAAKRNPVRYPLTQPSTQANGGISSGQIHCLPAKKFCLDGLPKAGSTGPNS